MNYSPAECECLPRPQAHDGLDGPSGSRWPGVWVFQSMTTHTKKQFGVWMDQHHATVAGRKGEGNDDFMILGHVKNAGAQRNSNENAANHEEIALTRKFFKEIAAIMPNVDEVHVTGTGQVQEQFIHFLSETPQYKHTACTESTSNKMDDEKLVAFIGKQFNG